MQTAVSSRSLNNYFYKMDNVLYEVKDQNGILRNDDYDSWKQEIIEDLAISGYIKPAGDKYVITKEGREVIKQDSFLYYNKKIKSEENSVAAVETKPVSIFKHSYFIALLTLLVLAAITIFRLR